MVITINIRFFGIFKRLSGKNQINLVLEETATVCEVISKLTETFSNEFKQVLVDSQLVDIRPNALILVGGKEISALQGLETDVKDGDEVVLIPMVHGG